MQTSRRALLNPAAPGFTVTDVAVEYGFHHLSYFARDYHALFGEYPSETLREEKK